MNKKTVFSIIALVILAGGLVVGIILVQRNQVLKSKASANQIYEGVQMSGINKSNDCTPNDNGTAYNCKTDQDTVNLDLSGLKSLTR